ncbi:MAG: hypothetical protein NZ805_07205 [Armatimonadetes bacterium]|nr:hypothetical protein [Armatimonadota bacterium]MDW8028310.1 hypothetical protein [Armatimonadota bacterium]
MDSTCTFAEALSWAQSECETALSQFLGTKVNFSPEECSERMADQLLVIVGQFSQIDEVNRAIIVGVYGDLQGYLVIFLPPEDADRLAAYMLEGETDPEMKESVLAEIGNLTTARLLMGISKGLKLNGGALPTPPVTQVDFSGALLQSLTALLLSQGQMKVMHSVWKLKVNLPNSQASGTAHFFLPL